MGLVLIDLAQLDTISNSVDNENHSTCAGENEANVRYVLDRWPQMQLVEQPIVIGRPGLIGDGLLSASEAELVQRFDPVLGEGDDTIGFFIAKFRKRAST